MVQEITNRKVSVGYGMLFMSVNKLTYRLSLCHELSKFPLDGTLRGHFLPFQ